MTCINPNQERCGYRRDGWEPNQCFRLGGPPPQCVREGQTPARPTDSPPGPAIVPDSGTQEQEPQYYEATKEVLDSLKWMAKDMDYRRSQTALCAEPLSPEMQDVRRIIAEMEAGTLIVTRVQTERSQ